MIRVTPAAEPGTFDARVRQPGLSAIDELIGLPPRVRRAGPRRKKVATERRLIPAARFPPLWREAIEDLRTAYDGRCAYLAMYLEPGTGSSTVDHFVPKSQDWRQVYEWANYRLCAGAINGTKNDRAVLDPFAVQAGWFALEFVSFQVIPGPAAPAAKLADIKDTIARTGVNLRGCCDLRAEYVRGFEAGEISRDYLARRAPFIEAELLRQGRIT